MIKLTDLLKEALEIDAEGNLVPNKEISSILKQLIVQNLGEYIGYEEEEIEEFYADENEWISEWEWSDRPYRMLTLKGFTDILFLDNDPKKLAAIYEDSINWYPSSSNILKQETSEEDFIKAIQEAYQGNLSPVQEMLPEDYSTILEMVKLFDKNQLIYIF
jgi:hypothetical protein